MENKQLSHETFEETVRVTSSYLFSLSYRLTGSYEEAKDLVQETYLKAWKNWNKLNEKDKAIPWLRQICINHHIDMYRKSKRDFLIKDPVFPHMEFDIVSKEPTPEDELLADEELRLIHSQCWAIITKTLPLFQQIVLVLHDVYGLRIEEVSTLIDQSDSATKSLLHRARNKMYSLISPYCTILKQDNICKCKSWIQFSHDIQKRRDFLKEMLSSSIKSSEDTASTRKKLIEMFNSLPYHTPPAKWIDTVIKKFQ